MGAEVQVEAKTVNCKLLSSVNKEEGIGLVREQWNAEWKSQLEGVQAKKSSGQVYLDGAVFLSYLFYMLITTHGTKIRRVHVKIWFLGKTALEYSEDPATRSSAPSTGDYGAAALSSMYPEVSGVLPPPRAT